MTAIFLVLLVAGLGAAAAVVLPSDPAVSPEPARSVSAHPARGYQVELLIPRDLDGAATLSTPTVTSPRVPPRTPRAWCSVLTAADIRELTGFAPQGAPDTGSVCTHHLTGSTGYLLVSEIPAPGGARYAVLGNSAIIYQSDPTACEVSVALNRRGGVLDIDIRGVTSPRVPLCEAAVALSVRVLDRLPTA